MYFYSSIPSILVEQNKELERREKAQELDKIKYEKLVKKKLDEEEKNKEKRKQEKIERKAFEQEQERLKEEHKKLKQKQNEFEKLKETSALHVSLHHEWSLRLKSSQNYIIKKRWFFKSSLVETKALYRTTNTQRTIRLLKWFFAW